jgi:hypothetical protein
MLEDEELREKEGKELAILNMATDKARNHLEQYHSFADNTLDKPFLIPEDKEKEDL